jgi:putative glutamine amidotransferase
MLTGGVDVDPAEYGESERHPTVEIDPERDRYELALARLALARDLPVLAICRGAQVLNTAAGGTLVQDIPSAFPDAIGHQQSHPKDAPVHDVTVSPGTCLWTLLAPQLAISSRCRSTAGTINPSPHPRPAFIVSAVSPDGIVEAIRKARRAVLRRRAMASGKLPPRRRVQYAVRGFVEAARRYTRRS